MMRYFRNRFNLIFVQVLSFQGYFQEAVHEKREEQFRVRKCKIYFYLEDDSIQVIEPTIKNSGIPQGTLIRRHRIPLPPPNDDEYYTVEHFNVGNEIVLYGRSVNNFALSIILMCQRGRNLYHTIGLMIHVVSEMFMSGLADHI